MLHTPIGFTLAAFTPLCRFPIRSYAAVVAMRRVGASFSLGVAVHVVAWLVVPMPAAALQFEAGDGPFSVGIADFNGDDHSDLAVTNYWTNTVSILLSNGDGTFSTPTAFGTGAYPVAVAVGDLNGDGEFDLAVVNYPQRCIAFGLLACRQVAEDVLSRRWVCTHSQDQSAVGTRQSSCPTDDPVS